MSDPIIKVGKSIIQHGKENDRIYLIKLDKSECFNVLSLLDQLINEYKYTKIFAKVPADKKQLFLDNDFIIEAYIPNFFNGNEDVFFLAKYFSDKRAINNHKEEISKVLTIAKRKDPNNVLIKLKDGFEFRECIINNADKIANLYRKVFESYPFPIDDPNYIAKTIQENIQYFGIWKDNDIVAIGSSEKDMDAQNTEMTDFATLPEYNGNNFSGYILNRMETEAKKQDIKVTYTIARAVSYGMNITFAKANYNFTGTLINNTNICGNLENMNVWYKCLFS